REGCERQLREGVGQIERRPRQPRAASGVAEGTRRQDQQEPACETVGMCVGTNKRSAAMSVLKTLLYATLAAVLLAACSSSAPLSKRDNFSYLYGKGSTQMPLQVRVHHVGNDRSRV